MSPFISWSTNCLQVFVMCCHFCPSFVRLTAESVLANKLPLRLHHFDLTLTAHQRFHLHVTHPAKISVNPSACHKAPGVSLCVLGTAELPRAAKPLGLVGGALLVHLGGGITGRQSRSKWEKWELVAEIFYWASCSCFLHFHFCLYILYAYHI